MFDRLPEIVGSRDLGHAHFQGKLFVRPLGIPDTKLHTCSDLDRKEPRYKSPTLLYFTKFEVTSSSSFRDIAL